MVNPRGNTHYFALTRMYRQHATFCNFILLCLFFISYPAPAQESGDWELVDEAVIEQGARFYDRTTRLYFTDNTVRIDADTTAFGELRLVVTDSSTAVSNAEGTMDSGQPYFTLNSPIDEQRIFFVRSRGAFSYSLAVMHYVENVTDTDNDGVPDSDDICPLDPNNDEDNDGICGDVDICPTDPLNDADEDGICDSDDFCLDDTNNMCISVSGVVLGNGAALESANVELGLGGIIVNTDMDGSFAGNVGPDSLKNDGSGNFIPLTVAAAGFSTGNVKVKMQGNKRDYSITVNLQQVSDILDENDDVTADGGVVIVKEGNPVGSLEIPTSSLPTGATQVVGTITYLDPETDDLLSSPGGDLLALPEDADPNVDDPVTLESFGMMEFNLQDQNGNEISELNGPAEVCMRATTGLVEGNTIPLWYYDEEQGLWIEEGEGQVVERDGELLICGNVEHFTWWNYDQPITTHSCLRYEMRDEATGEALDNLNWYAEGATYNGSSPARNCASGSDEFDAFTVKISAPLDEQSIRVYTFLGGTKFYLASDEDSTYSLTTSVTQAADFPTPTANGSCLSGILSGTCWLLDYQDGVADGILPIDLANINLPPVITEFELDESFLIIGESMGLSVTVTDSEGDDVSLDWQTNCGYYGDTSTGTITNTVQTGSSGTNFTNSFTAPDTLSYPVEYCQIVVNASDPQGAESTASRWITVASSFEYDISGVVYGTDGQPAPFVSVDYYNWDCDGLNQTTTTSANGEFSILVDLQSCSNNSEQQFYSPGLISVFFEYDGLIWGQEHYLDNFYDIGPSSDGVQLASTSPATNGCYVNDDGSTSCYIDIFLPTLWAEISGDIVDLPFIEEVGLNYDVYNFDEFYNGYGLLWLAQYIPLQPSDTTFGPLSVPIGRGEFYLYGATADDPSTGRSYPVDIWNQDPVIRDIGDFLEAPVEITILDDNGDAVVGADVELNSNSGLPPTSGITDNNGSVSLDSGLFYITGNAFDSTENRRYYFDSIVTRWDIPTFIDINGLEQCSVTTTIYDERGEVVEGLFVQWYSGSNENGSAVTDINGEISFMVRPGYLDIYTDDAPYFYRYIEINHCREEGGLPREIDIDIQTNSNTGYYFDLVQF